MIGLLFLQDKYLICAFTCMCNELGWRLFQRLIRILNSYQFAVSNTETAAAMDQMMMAMDQSMAGMDQLMRAMHLGWTNC